MSSPPKVGRGDLPYLAFLTFFAFAVYWEVFVYDSFGPETALYYFYSDGISFAQAIRSFLYFQLMWYRPITSVLYWVGEQFVGWHDLVGWKLVHFVTVLAALYAIYWLVVTCLRGPRLAGLLAASWFAAQPNVYPGVMEAAGFDFVHICFTLLCAGLYLRATRSSGWRMIRLTALAWLCFLIALCSKEAALTVPLYLAAVSVLVACFDSKHRPPWYRELLRLAPFFAVLPLYYFLHYTKVAPGAFSSSGPYRSGANWGMILANVRKMSLWILRIYGFTGDTVREHMYHSNPLNNLTGIAAAVLVAVMWFRRVRQDPSWRLEAALMLSWTAVFLMLPIYGGGFLWHINLPLVGYSILFGLAAAWAWEAVPSIQWRTAAAALFFLGLAFLARHNLHTELYDGMHSLAFRINHSVLSRPPVAPDRLGKAPLVFIEDRLGVGGWWYGCFGILFNYTYLRHDLEEVVVPQLAAVPPDLRARWLAHPNAYFFRLDDQFNWRDGSAEFRSAIAQGKP